MGTWRGQNAPISFVRKFKVIEIKLNNKIKTW